MCIDIGTITDVLIAAATLGALIFMHRENKHTAHLPYISMLKDQLDDVVLSLYYLFNHPAAMHQLDEKSSKVLEDSFQKHYDGFLSGHRYFVISSIPRENDQIKSKLGNASRRKMYFNDLRKKYITTFNALKDVTAKAGSKKQLSHFMSLTEYEAIFDSYSGMTDIE